MGLRINHNVTAYGALRNLRINDRNLARSLERLATGLRIVRASDDPSGLVISEQLRAQISALEQAVDNSLRATNLIGTADAALQEVSNLLVEIKDSLVFVMNEGSLSAEEIAAEQDAVDAAIAALERIANTTRFAGQGLLNGVSDYVLQGVSNEINDLVVRSVRFAPGVSSLTFALSGVTSAARGMISIGSTAANTVIRVTGPRGTADIAVDSATTATVMAAINEVAGVTGVYASQNPTGATAVAFTEEYGSDQTIQIEVVGGGIQMRAGVMNTPPAALVEAGERAVDGGQDAQLIHNGVVYTGEGRHFSIATSLAHFEFSLEPVYTNAAAQAYILPGQISFIVRNSGLVFQLNDAARSSDQLSVGIESVIPGVLGFEEVRDVISSAQSGSTLQMGGYLTSLKSGGENDLTSERLGNALAIVNYAIKQVAQLRGFLGAVQADNIEPNINALEVAIENLTASESSIRDLDFAAETSEFTRTQILFQAGTAVLASANLIPQTVLTLLQ